MNQLYLLALLLTYTNSEFLSGVYASKTFTFVNKCAYTIWPVILSSAGSTPISNTGFVLQEGDSNVIQAPSSWNGRFWARTHCSVNSTGKFTCLTGDCGSGKIECDGDNTALPVTLVEFSLNSSGGMDFYDVSLVDGYNIPLLVVPQSRSGANCSSTGCMKDLDNVCPWELIVKAEGGDDIACKSPCAAYKQDEYCCTGAYSTPATCNQTDYSAVFKTLCPSAYSYAFDDQSSIFTCSDANYVITFCPSPGTRGKSSLGSPTRSPDGNRNVENNKSMPWINSTMIYDGASARDFYSSGAASTCMHVLRPKAISGAVATAIAIWRLCIAFNFFE